MLPEGFMLVWVPKSKRNPGTSLVGKSCEKAFVLAFGLSDFHIQLLAPPAAGYGRGCLLHKGLLLPGRLIILRRRCCGTSGPGCGQDEFARDDKLNVYMVVHVKQPE